MHSGADVDAFQAALNRDIGGDASTSQPPASGRGFSILMLDFFFFLDFRLRLNFNGKRTLSNNLCSKPMAKPK